MNEKARDILTFIVQFQNEHGAPPTMREIGEAFRIRSTNGVCYYLDLLEKAGAIVRRRGLARGIELHPEIASAAPELAAHLAGSVGLPILGQIAAGGPVLAEENIEGVLDAARLGDTSASFALRVTGQSMRDAGILDGDYVLVQATSEVRNGEIVVAMIGEETTVKRFERKGARVLLNPENQEYAPIVVTARSPELRILGKVVGVYREY